MSKPWFAFSKRAAGCVGVSAILALSLLADGRSARAAPGVPPPAKAESAGAPVLSPNLPEREVRISTRGGQTLRVGDSVAYHFEGSSDPAAESQWSLDPKIGGLKMGFLFRPGRLFTPLMAGELSLPAIAILDADGKIVARSKPLSIVIASNISEAERKSGQPPKPEAALGPMGLPFPAWIQSAIAFTFLAFVLIGAYFVMRYLRRKAAAALKKILPKKPYDVAALERLDTLMKSGMKVKDSYKPFYFGVSETLKFYLGERFDFDAQESTTSELIALMRERSGTLGLTEKIIERTRAIFDRLDPVKFADVVPSPDEAKEIYREARELITSTRKVTVEPIAPLAASKAAP